MDERNYLALEHRADIIDWEGLLSSLCVTNKIIWSEVNTQRPNNTNCLLTLLNDIYEVIEQNAHSLTRQFGLPSWKEERMPPK